MILDLQERLDILRDILYPIELHAVRPVRMPFVAILWALILARTRVSSCRNRMSALAEKARQGTLAERAEADGFERVSGFLGFLKSKARVSLKNATAGK